MQGSCARRFRTLLRLRPVDMQDLDGGRLGQDLAEGVHPIAGFLARPDALVAELIELVEFLQFNLELKPGAIAMAAGQRHPQAGVEAVSASGFDLAVDDIDRALPIDRPNA